MRTDIAVMYLFAIGTLVAAGGADADEKPDEARGLVLSAATGVDLPLGDSEPEMEGASLAGDLFLGYAAGTHFAFGGVFHWGTASAMAQDFNFEPMRPRSGSWWLVGAEIRGIYAEGPLQAWGSVGLGMGQASFDYDGGVFCWAESVPDRSGCGYADELDVGLGLGPVLGGGVEFAVAERVRLGPWLRWFVLHAGEACATSSSGPERCRGTDSAYSDFIFGGLAITYAPDWP